MKKLIFFAFAIALFINTCYAGDSTSSQKTKQVSTITKKSAFEVNFLYTERGFGPSVSYYFTKTQDMDYYLSLAITSVSDGREITRYDDYGNSIIANKEHRIFIMPLSFGFKKALFKDDIAGSIFPTISAGVAPTLVFSNPYELGFFNALGKTTTSYAIGPFAGVGMIFAQEKSSATYTFDLKYYYLKVIGNKVNSLFDTPIDNVGGIQLGLGVHF